MAGIPGGVSRFFSSFIPLTNSGRLSRWSYLLDKVNSLEPRSQSFSNSELRKESLSLRYRVKSGEPLDSLLPEAYALVREAGRRTLNMRHFDVQILGGIAVFNRSIVEMQTGEGKTLTATLPMYLYALAGKGSLLATVNDYLAKRDAEWMEPIYNALGMKIGIVQERQPDDQSRKAYTCDVTYGTAKEFGFDFLRDRLQLRKIKEGEHDLLGSMLNQKAGGAAKSSDSAAGGLRNPHPPYFALVDEADSILIDEASTPLIISAAPTEEERKRAACFYWAAQVARLFEEKTDYEYDHKKRKVGLTKQGRLKARNLDKPKSLDETGLFDIYEFTERAIFVNREYHKDAQYVVRKGEIVIVDEFTGRLGEGRKWRDGIHQAVEAKEGVKISLETGQAARITVQDFFLRFEKLAGMTGTAASSARELHRVFHCKVVPVPTNCPPRRVQLKTLIYGTEEAKWNAIMQEVISVHQTGRPVLIGTRTIGKSVVLSELLQKAGVPHNVLNAHQIAQEAEIVSKAGERGKVTVSTNMAGRGTDIKLPDVIREIGGLHVICTEMHESARIDRQLIGRCGRQGDPGTYRQYLSLEDELLEKAFGPKRAKRYKKQGKRQQMMSSSFARLFRRAQRKVETKSYRNRKIMLYYEKERKKIQRSMGQDPYLDTPH
ncbi:MAG: translocase [Planctomycetaceae bacterium]|jgi:preprotein translocase subunit SecA|nr:translocase [Planctomycetaceae bacterium]